MFLWATTSRDPDLRRTQSELNFLDPKDGKRKPFPKISDPPSLYLSLVVPAYKEQSRRECQHHFAVSSGPYHLYSAKDDE